MFNWVNRIVNSTYRNPADWFVEFMTGGKSDSGVVVNKKTALSYAPVWQANATIAGDLASMPLDEFSRNGNSRTKEYGQSYWLLNEQPNQYMTGNILRETLQSHANMHGNGYAAIERDRGGRPLRLVPMMPDETEPVCSDGQLFYVNRSLGEEITLNASDVFHIKGLGDDGIKGFSVIDLARNSWGLGLAQEKHGNRHFKNGAKPTVVLKHPSTLTKEQADDLLEKWNEKHGGVDGESTALAAGGLEVQLVPISNENAQWLDSRRFSRVEVASWFNLPPHKLGDDSRISYNSLEAEERAYVNMTLHRWIVKWEKECDAKLLRESDRRNRTRYHKFNTKELLRGDTASRFAAYEVGIRSRILSPNEARAAEEMEPYEGGDSYENPNTTPGKATPTESANTEALAAHRELIIDRAERMLKVEREKVIKASRKDGNFLEWVDRFYSTWPDTVASSLRPVVNAVASVTTCSQTADEIAAEMSRQSRELILNVAGYSYTDNLADNIAEAVEQWDGRADEIANSLMEQ